ncbi:MAG: SRPBCC family protein [Flavobacteriales bacterium]|nr:SRPBCC family protein [Flavobacteriales bacterium]NNK80805.1 SRPBCC family protein [Flavobacteriales bacterium]
MKILKYLLLILLSIIVLVVVIGLFSPSVSYGYTVDIKKPIEKTWDISQDQSQYHKWLEGFQSMELLSGEYMKEGSTYKVIVNPGEGQDDFEMIETLISIKENDHVQLHFDSEMMDFDQTMTFTEENGVTTIKTDSKVIPKGVMMRAMFTLMEGLGGAFTKQEAKNMEALKELVESSD